VLLAPYWRFVGRWQNAFWPLLRLWARRWRPLAMADFTDERVRIGIRRILPDLDLDNEGVRTELRDFIVPTRLLDELRKLGGATARTARRSSAPTLIVQGLRDGLVRPHDTELLAALIPSARLELLDATHNVTEPTDGAWDRVRRNVLEFLDNTGAASQL
jgi:pimeloyl-ACP methyl ester carboxylesterase